MDWKAQNFEIANLIWNELANINLQLYRCFGDINLLYTVFFFYFFYFF
jgi:hypothetical protein